MSTLLFKPIEKGLTAMMLSAFLASCEVIAERRKQLRREYDPAGDDNLFAPLLMDCRRRPALNSRVMTATEKSFSIFSTEKTRVDPEQSSAIIFERARLKAQLW
jgi:hypothetical protein